jgi:hypothetical protein
VAGEHRVAAGEALLTVDDEPTWDGLILVVDTDRASTDVGADGPEEQVSHRQFQSLDAVSHRTSAGNTARDVTGAGDAPPREGGHRRTYRLIGLIGYHLRYLWSSPVLRPPQATRLHEANLCHELLHDKGNSAK